MSGFRLAADMISQSNQYSVWETVTNTQKLEQERKLRYQKAQNINGIDIKQLTNNVQEVPKGNGNRQQRHYLGLERRDFNIRMRVTIKYLQDEICLIKNIIEWYSTLYIANNSIFLYQFEPSRDGKQLENPYIFPQKYAE